MGFTHTDPKARSEKIEHIERAIRVNGGVHGDDARWMLNEYRHLTSVLRDLAEKSHDADTHDCCTQEWDGDPLEESPPECDCSACTAGVAWRQSYVAALELLAPTRSEGYEPGDTSLCTVCRAPIWLTDIGVWCATQYAASAVCVRDGKNITGHQPRAHSEELEPK